jgi:DNA-binding MarR family transcriptional regulator
MAVASPTLEFEVTSSRKPQRRTAPTAREAIGQTRPFRSAAQEAVVALLLTAEAVRNRFAALLAGHEEITFQQYNVLRILRGAGAAGLPTLEIVERMVEKTPGITRLIDRLEAARLVERERPDSDRRQVFCRITGRGEKLLRELDPKVDALDDDALASLSKREVTGLVALLDRIRNHATRAGEAASPPPARAPRREP